MEHSSPPFYYRIDCDPETGAYAFSCAQKVGKVPLFGVSVRQSKEEALFAMLSFVRKHEPSAPLICFNVLDEIHLSSRDPKIIQGQKSPLMDRALAKSNAAVLAKHHQALFSKAGKHCALILPSNPITPSNKMALQVLGAQLSQHGVLSRVAFVGGKGTKKHPFVKGVSLGRGGMVDVSIESEKRAGLTDLLFYHVHKHREARAITSDPVAVKSAQDYHRIFYAPETRCAALSVINLCGQSKKGQIKHVGDWVSRLTKHTSTPYFCSPGVALHQTLRLLPKEEGGEVEQLIDAIAPQEVQHLSKMKRNPFIM